MRADATESVDGTHSAMLGKGGWRVFRKARAVQRRMPPSGLQTAQQSQNYTWFFQLAGYGKLRICFGQNRNHYAETLTM